MEAKQDMKGEKRYFLKSGRKFLLALSITSSITWFLAVAIHMHITDVIPQFRIVESVIFSNPISYKMYSGDRAHSITGTISMITLLVSIVFLRMPKGKARAIFDAFFVVSVLTVLFEIWLYTDMDMRSWFDQRFSILETGTVLDNIITNELITVIAVSCVLGYVGFFGTKNLIRKYRMIYGRPFHQ